MKNYAKFNHDFTDLKITPRAILEVIGNKESDDSDFMLNMISEILDKCREIADVKSEYRIFENISFNVPAKSVIVLDKEFDVKPIIFNQLKRSASAAFFLCTAGMEIGARSRKAMNERDLLTGYIYDVIGSELVEAAAGLVQSEIEKEALSEGMKITNRYSPGYCGWDVSEQHKFFTFFPNNHCEVQLGPSALMNPEKSVSGIIGMGENVRLNQYTCRVCDMKDCIYRRTREK